MIGDLGAGEMTHQQREAMIFRLHARSDGSRLVHRDAEPVHAGVDVERRAAAPVLDGDEGIPFGQLGRAVDHRPQIVDRECRRRARHQPVEHVDDGLGRKRPHTPSFGDIGDEEGPAPGFGQYVRDRFEAATISVGLDHCGAFHRHGQARQHLPIGFDGGKVDGEDASGFRWVGSGGGRDIGGPQVGLVDGHG